MAVLILTGVALILILRLWAYLEAFFTAWPHAWRFLSGNFLHAHRARRWRDEMSRKQRLRRAATRTGGLTGVIGLAWLYTYHHAGTVHGLYAAAAVSVVSLAWLTWRRAPRIPLYLRWTLPAKRKVATELGHAPPKFKVIADRQRTSKQIPLWKTSVTIPLVTYAPREITVGWADDKVLADGEQKALTHVVSKSLAIEAPVEDWRQRAGKREVTYTRSEPPPANVWLTDILPTIKSEAEHEIILGLGKQRERIGISLDTDTPHLGFCMKSGRGKSKAAGNVAAQILYHGGNTMFLDWKLTSHQWARGLPNVSYAGTAAEIHEAVCWLAQDTMDDDGNVIGECELTRRKNVILTCANIAGEVPAGVDVGARLLIVVEELNALQGKLKRYWRQIGGKGPSPACEGLDELLFTGREFRVHVLQIGQRLSAKATSGSGSADSRENLGGILFSNPSDSTWKMLTDGAAKPPASEHPGRHQWYTNDTPHEMQGVLYHANKLRAAEMMRELAMAGTVTPAPWDMPFVVRPAGVPAVVGHDGARAMEAPDQGIVVQQIALPPARDPGTVTLREAVEAGMWPTLHAARQAKQRHKPPKVGAIGSADLYRIDDLEACRVRERR